MRLYLFSNHYISPVQHGIQGIHSFGEVVLKMLKEKPARSRKSAAMLTEFLTKHKTVVVLNGGPSAALEAIHDTLEVISRDWPKNVEGAPHLLFGKFHEDAASLNGALTSVAVLVPSCAVVSDSMERSNLIREVADMGFASPFEAAADTELYGSVKCLSLLCASFPLTSG